MVLNRPGRGVRCGIGLRTPHLAEALARPLPVDAVELHAENFFAEGGAVAELLRDLSARYATSLHGVGLSLGSSDPIDARHLRALKRVVDSADPVFVSEHLCWSAHNGIHTHDLLPLPRNEHTVALLVRRVDQVQQYLSRRILLENIVSYILPPASIPEGIFLAEIARRTGCGILLDLNNLHVNHVNHGEPPATFLAAMDWACVSEIHLAGPEDEGPWLVDTHGAPVPSAVWSLLAAVSRRLRDDVLILVERDTNLPSVDALIEEAGRAGRVVEEARCHAEYRRTW